MGTALQWIELPDRVEEILAKLDLIITNQESIMTSTERVRVATELLVAQNVAIADGTNALLQNNVNLQKALDDLKSNGGVDNSALEALEKAVSDNGAVADHFKATADPTTPTPTTPPVVEPAPDTPAADTVPVPAATDTPAIPAPGGETTPADVSTAGAADATATTDTGAATPPDATATAATDTGIPAPPVPADGSGVAPQAPEGSVDNTGGSLG